MKMYVKELIMILIDRDNSIKEVQEINILRIKEQQE